MYKGVAIVEPFVRWMLFQSQEKIFDFCSEKIKINDRNSENTSHCQSISPSRLETLNNVLITTVVIGLNQMKYAEYF